MDRNLERLAREVRTLQVQGASAVAHETLHGFAAYVRSLAPPSNERSWRALRRLGDELGLLRPTEPMARNVVRWYLSLLERGWSRARATLSWADHAATCAHEVRYALKEAEARLVAGGARLVKARQVIFTHCHSSLAERLLVAAWQAGRRFQVYHTETRPLFQGRTTDENLRRVGIPTTMVVDGAATYLVSRHSGDDVDVSWVLLGADSLGRDGSVVNKIGSFGISLAAYESQVPVYVAATLLKLDSRGKTVIELRSGDEVWAGAPAGTRIVNYAFDRVPARFITGIVCEFGVVRPAAVAALARRRYPWMALRK